MATFDWPAWLKPSEVVLVPQRSIAVFRGAFNSLPQAIDYGSARWKLSLTVPASSLADRGRTDAFLTRLYGGVNRVRYWHLPTGGVPAGSLRGSPKLLSNTVVGDGTIYASCVAGDRLRAGDMLGLNGQLIMVAADAAASSNGAYRVAYAGPDGAYNGHEVRTSTTYTSAAFVELTVGVAAKPMVFGLRTTDQHAASTTSPFNQFQFALRLMTDGTLRIYEAGVLVGTFGTWAAGDRFKVRYINSSARYYQNDVVLRDVNPDNDQTLTMAIAFAGDGQQITGLRFGNDSTDADFNNFSVTATDATLTVSRDYYIAIPCATPVRTLATYGTAVVWDHPTADFILPSYAGLTAKPGYCDSFALDLEEVWDA